MAHKISPGGSYVVDIVFPPPVGRLAIASGARTKKDFADIVACFRRLRARGRLDVLSALKAKRVTVSQVLNADRTDALDGLMASLTPSRESEPLWASVQKWLGPKEERSLTVKRYGVSFAKLERLAVLPDNPTVAALSTVDWPELNERWTGSGTDWNQMRRAVSHFLTVHLKDVFHPLRRAVVAAIPKGDEIERVPDLDVETFWKVVNSTPEHVRPAYVALVVLGLRVGEYLRIQQLDLLPITKSVRIPGTKTAGSVATVRVDPELWPYVTAAIPSPVGYQWLRKHWKRALSVVGADPTLRLHDLRHLTAQLLVDAGRSEASVQTTMRHNTASMTRRYAKQKDRGENAATLARVLLPKLTA